MQHSGAVQSKFPSDQNYPKNLTAVVKCGSEESGNASDVNGENHEEALGNSNSEAESAEDDETVENLNVVLAWHVNWDCHTSLHSLKLCRS